MIDYIWRVNGLDVFYTNETNGGGDFLALEYMQVVKEWYNKVDSVLEWCSGPGFIGYSFLATGLCDKVAFNDMYEPAIVELKKTRDYNKLEQVEIHQGSTLENIKDVQYDLVVGNPPHWKDVESASNSLGFDVTQFKHIEDILVDKDWAAHKSFYNNVKKLLRPDGKILLQENGFGSTPKDFEKIVTDAGLKITSYAESVMYKDKQIYYLEVAHK